MASAPTSGGPTRRTFMRSRPARRVTAATRKASGIGRVVECVDNAGTPS